VPVDTGCRTEGAHGNSRALPGAPTEGARTVGLREELQLIPTGKVLKDRR